MILSSFTHPTLLLLLPPLFRWYRRCYLKRGQIKHLHAPRAGGREGRDDSYGRTECCESRTEQDNRREGCDPEDVPGNLIWKKIRERSADCGWQGVLLLQRG